MLKANFITIWFGSCLMLLPLAASVASADVTEFTDAQAWQDAVGPFTVIDFTDAPSGTLASDQYSDLGVTFTFGFNQQVFCCGFPSFVDGAGLQNVLAPIEVLFDVPQSWIAVTTPQGFVGFELYNAGQLVASTGVLGESTFIGLVSSDLFDSAIIFNSTGGSLGGDLVVIDNLYFGVPGPSALPLLALAGIKGRRRTT